MNNNRNSVLLPLPLSRRFSRAIALPNFGVRFEVDWDPSNFLIKQFEGQARGELGSTLTLTGSFEDAQATTCMSYMQQTWPSSGEHTVKLLNEVLLESGIWIERKLPDDTALFAQISNSKLTTVVLGNRDAVAEIGEQLAWISAALRLAPNDQGIHICTPSIQQIQIDDHLTSLPGELQSVDASFSVSCEISGPPTEKHSTGQCWHDLFKNAMIVQGYPIPRRSRENTGLEIPLDILSALLQAPQITTFGSRTFLKGFSSMLILMDQTEDSVIWHLDFNRDGSSISYLDASKPPFTEGIGFEDCLNAKFYTGTDKAPYPVKKPALDALNDECILHGIQTPRVKAIEKQHNYHIADKEKPTHMRYGENLHQRLEKLKDQYVILWDVESERGWLVNGTSAWLHLLRARLKQVSEDGCGPELKEPLISSRYTVQSALKFFKNAKNMELAVYPNEDQRETYPFTIRDQSDRLYYILDNLLENQKRAVSSRNRASRKYLSGWAFRDLVMEKEQLEPYATTLPETGRSWIDFTRAIFAVTLFGRGFGELIDPDEPCEAWTKLPRGLFFLATSGQVLKRIMDDVGNSPGQPWRLGRDIVWHNPTKSCKCAGGAESSHADNIQVLLPEDVSKEILPQGINSEEPEDNSAFVFGFNPELGWRWQEFGKPTKTTPSSLPENFKSPTSVEDSGIGSESGMSESPLASAKVYTVGILCTLPVEGAAMKTLFDEVHGEPDNYILGSIGHHNVVLAYSPLEPGIATASAAASKLARDYPRIRFGLLVGIAGGVPSSAIDIRLGDVVVGVPKGIYPGVIQLGRGKDLENNEFERTGSLNKPPGLLLGSVASLTAQKEQCSSQLNELIKSVVKSEPKYQYPGQQFDVLNSGPCNQCRNKCTDRHNHIPNREPRASEQPVVHLGLIGSGDTVIKNSEKRDELAKKFGIICIEMEAAGVMSGEIPFLVIRGISDYADPEKNDHFHNYASLTAAACAKLLLNKVTAIESRSEPCPRDSKRNLSQHNSPPRNTKRRLDANSFYSSEARF
ncbi:hypothetical protein F4803DRAFT_569193 [Xylaria telfairii]|nr:hypothetical protein F4803DRAFT_569193 [Xylaria telfairii]